MQQLGGSGVTHDPKFAQKKEARAKRFQLEGQLPEPSYNDVQLMYDSLEVPKDQRDPENTEKLHRFETIHITGFSTKVRVYYLYFFKERYTLLVSHSEYPRLVRPGQLAGNSERARGI